MSRSQLMRIWRLLDQEERARLLAYAERLSRQAHSREIDPNLPPPAPAEETVVAALRRLTRRYPMLERAPLIAEAADLMSTHVLGGRPAAEVIEALEAVYQRHYRAQVSRDNI